MTLKIRAIVIAGVVSGLAGSQNLAVAACATPVTYLASGHFGTNVVKGSDGYRLAGQPFSITLYACEGKTPSQKGAYDSVFTGIAMVGTVKSALVTSPYTIRATPMTLILDAPPTGPDLIQMSGNVNVFGSQVNIHGSIAVPAGTLTSTAIGPFLSSPVAIVTAHSALQYSYPSWQKSTPYSVGQQILDPAGNGQKVQSLGTSGATAPVWNESLNGTTTDGGVTWICTGPYTPTQLALFGTASGTVTTPPGAGAAVLLHDDAVDVITSDADGTESVRPLRAAPVDLSASTDKVMLRLYASGLRYASDIHVEIAGQQVPVVHAGPSADFAGLDEVVVELPRTLAGVGKADMVLTVDGQAASPVPVHIQ